MQDWSSDNDKPARPAASFGRRNIANGPVPHGAAPASAAAEPPAAPAPMEAAPPAAAAVTPAPPRVPLSTIPQPPGQSPAPPPIAPPMMSSQQL